MSTIATVLNKLKKTYTDTFLDVKDSGTVKRLFLESPQLNFTFGGGFAMGRIYEFYGPESGGKSTLATYIGGEVQKKSERNIVVYVDFEHSFDEKYANTLGLSTDEDNFIFIRPDCGEDAFLILKQLITELPVGLIIYDSIATTAARSELIDPIKATYGGAARVLGIGLKYLNPALSKTGTSLLLINQERANMDPMAYVNSTPGGFAPKYYASWRGRITRIDDIKDKGSLVGIVSKLRNTKSKIGIPKREAELELRFASGFDSENEYLKFIIDLGIVEQRGAWVFQEEWGFKGQGKTSVLEYLRERPELFASVKNSVNAMLCGETVLDIENSKSEEEDAEEAIS